MFGARDILDRNLFIDDALKVLGRGRSENTENVIQLIQVVLSGEYRSSREHLCQNAAHGPDVYWLCVTLKSRCEIVRNLFEFGLGSKLFLHFLGHILVMECKCLLPLQFSLYIYHLLHDRNLYRRHCLSIAINDDEYLYRIWSFLCFLLAVDEVFEISGINQTLSLLE